MPEEGKVLGQAGISIPDVYDVVGSQAPIDRLSSEEPQYVHEMGSTIFSERFSGQIGRNPTGDIDQNVTIGTIITGLNAPINRLHGLSVWNAGNNTVARLLRLAIYSRAPDGASTPLERENLIWIWDGTVTAATNMDEGTVATVEYLNPVAALTQLPAMQTSQVQPLAVPEFAMRGRTLGFGAGTIELILNTHFGFAEIIGVSSYGLPIPSW